MDPQAALLSILEYVANGKGGEGDEAWEMLDGLREWVRRGGYVPDLGEALKDLDERK